MISNRIWITIASWLCFGVALGVALLPLVWRDRREVEIVLPTEIDLGTVKKDVMFFLPVDNKSSRAISIVGAKSSCGCLVPSHLPVEIPAKTTKHLACHYSGESTNISESLEFRIQLFATTKIAPSPVYVLVTQLACDDVTGNGPLEPIPMEN